MDASSAMRRLAALTFFLAMLGAVRPCAADDALTKAKQFLDPDNPGAAYELLLPLQSERAGDPSYDSLLGIAALDSGRPSEAVFAFERVLAVQPDNRQARAELARTYFELGEQEAAKREFEDVRRMGIPPEVDATISWYLDAIQQSAPTVGTRLRSYIEVGAGYDSNVNAATSASLVAVPVFGGALFELAPGAVAQSDSFALVTAGTAARYPMSSNEALFATVDGLYRWNSSVRDFDRGQIAYSAGANWSRGKNIFTLALQGDNFWLARNTYRNAYGGVAQWQYNIDARTQTTAYLQYADVRYPGQDFRNADRYVAGVGIAHAFRSRRQPIGYAGAYVGTEREKDAQFSSVGFSFSGLRAGGELSLGQRSKGFLNIALERRVYGAEEPFFLLTRRDWQFDVRMGVEWRAWREWRVVPALQHTRNDSNVVLNDFRRTIVSVSVWREF